MGSPNADILIVTVTKTESRAVIDVFAEATKQRTRPFEVDGRTYFELGAINGAAVFMTQSEMGAGGLGSSLQTVQKGIKALSPAAVIMVGLAFGADQNWQAIGDILVSENLRHYEPQRSGMQQIIPRGSRPDVSPRLLNRMKSADLTWDGAPVRFGVLLTGEKLVDHLAFRAQLLCLEPEAIGGEMEGAGLYAACQEEKIDWILVKAICDWADGEKERDRGARQQTAATNAAKFVLHALQFTPFHRPGVAPIPWAVETTSHSSLPTQPFFFGREKDLAVIAKAVQPDSRTWGVLIDGPGGIGKTALAVRAGHLAPAEHYPRKIFLSAKIRHLTPGGEQKVEDFMLPNYLALLSELALELGDRDLARTPENERANAVRRALTGQRALIVIDNVESFPEAERVRLYHFLNVLPHGCKAIVTSRRRSDVSAQVIRVDRMEKKDAFELLGELAKTNRHLAKTESEWETVYEMTGGNPQLLRWTVGQLGRRGSQCRTLAEAIEFLKNAPPDNDPLEYIFGDLLGTFTPSETAVLAALTHFTQPAPVKWIADLANLAERQAETALDDLADRAILVSDSASQMFYLPPLAARYLSAKRSEAVAQAADRLSHRAYALAIENGFNKYDRFSTLEAEWPLVTAALATLVAGENARLQEMCGALTFFLDFSGHWDEWLWVEQEAEQRAIAANDFYNAGWQAYRIGWVHYLRHQAADVLTCSRHAEEHWRRAHAGAFELATAIRLRGLGFALEKNYAAALTACEDALILLRALDPESENVASSLNSLADVERQSGDYLSAERDYLEALRIAKSLDFRVGVASYTGNLAEVAVNRQDWAAAESFAHEALTMAEALGRPELIGFACSQFAQALAHSGRATEGLPYARRAVEIFTRQRQHDNLAAAQAALQACAASE